MKRRQKGAFTLIELMVVVAILGILAAVVMQNVSKHSTRGKIAATQSQMSILETALYTYQLQVGRFPSTEQGLAALVKDPGEFHWEGPYLVTKTVPNDAWENPFVYICPPEQAVVFDLSSWGPDETEGTEDDIANWERGNPYLKTS